ncbi:glycoside hydrolase family 64 protein [Mycobacterium sp. CVI_P3]|uniref:Glycoside hydrolase family 64 protein n=1 Tax=Mycobacterium pinniadriaticum TaxID=2994102 RepID=A0ABT3SLS9_9MYCO|nr:glycoside hydrolase family 64 protein [Mycobacterium pinniadriaticum]MCX2933845.1 glycoside hydrolase family 64 protein [Mycobacterium pinniadriaticum]MCX2940302.1 glycoside hydrolase family 64 protein [Mycobacterium pinniadriaticum]
MKWAAHLGWVGALAVAGGIGAALLASPAISSAELSSAHTPSKSSSARDSSPGRQSAGETRKATGTSARATGHTRAAATGNRMAGVVRARTVTVALPAVSGPARVTVPKAAASPTSLRSIGQSICDWLQRTFDAASPTFPAQTHSEALDAGETSTPFALGGLDTEGRHLVYGIHGQDSGIGTAGGTLSISGSNATYTPPGSWDGATPYSDTFQVTTSDLWSPPHIHGLSGLLNLVTFGLLGSSGHTATGTLTVAVEPYSAGTFPVDFVNNSPYQSNQLYVFAIGQTSKNQWAWVDQNGTAHAINHDDANAPGHLVKDGVNYANMSYTLDEAGNLRIPPELQGARIYVSVDQPLYIAISTDNTGWTVPDPVGVTNPNYDTVYDWFELSYAYGAVPFGGNTTQVDQFGLPLSFTVVQASSGFSATRGTAVGRDQVFSTYQSSVPAEFQQLVISDTQGNPLRIASPRSTQPGGLATYLDEPIDAFWTKYRTDTFTFTSPGTYTVTGQVDADNRFAYTVTALNPAGVSGSYVMDKPTTAQVFAGDGPFVGTHEQGAFLAQLDAAFNRGVAASPDLWDDATAYYPADVKSNAYAQVFHELGLDGKNYGFPYDDVNNQSSVLILNNSLPPDVVTIAIN